MTDIHNTTVSQEIIHVQDELGRVLALLNAGCLIVETIEDKSQCGVEMLALDSLATVIAVAGDILKVQDSKLDTIRERMLTPEEKATREAFQQTTSETRQ